MREPHRLIRPAPAAASLWFLVLVASAQPTPCGMPVGREPAPATTGLIPFAGSGTAAARNPHFVTSGLIPVAGGLVYDSDQGLCWLADANRGG